MRAGYPLVEVMPSVTVEVRLNADTTITASPKHPCVYVGGLGFGGVRISGDLDAMRRLVDALAETIGRDGQPAGQLMAPGDAAEAASEAYASGWDAAIASSPSRPMNRFRRMGRRHRTGSCDVPALR
jgi:hypothetical protein